MKKKLTYLISVFIFAAFLCACSEGEGSAADTADSVEEVTINSVKDTADDTEDAESDAAGSAYADIYISEIEKLSSSGEADLFALVYVDDDEIPELAAVSSEGSWDKDQVFLYTADGKETVLLASDIAPGMEGHYIAFFEKENIIVKSGAAIGAEFKFIKIENHKPVETLRCSRIQMTDADGNDIDVCKVNDKEVSADEYIAAMQEAIPSVKMTKLAEVGAADMVSYKVNLDDGYMKLIDAESTPYYSYDEIIGILKK